MSSDIFGTPFSAQDERLIAKQTEELKQKKIESFEDKEKRCTKCGKVKKLSEFGLTRSFMFSDEHVDVCNQCVDEILMESDFDWDIMDKVCQYADIPFIPKKFADFVATSNRGDVWKTYSTYFYTQHEAYEGIGWSDYYEAFKDLKAQGKIEDELPLLNAEHKRELKERWGSNYDDEALNYLQNLYEGLLSTQIVNGALQSDQAYKLCKISYEIDKDIAAGQDVDKKLSAYEKLVKTGNFTPSNAKNANDFESFGEVAHWLEKRGWKNQYYDGVTRDIVDETIKNIKAYNQHLYTDETGIGDEISSRIQALKTANEIENRYGLEKINDVELEDYTDDGYNPDEEEDFDVEV